MLKSFINAKTGEKVRLDIQGEVTKEKLEGQLGVKIKGNLPIEDIPAGETSKKRGRPKKEVLDDNTAE